MLYFVCLSGVLWLLLFHLLTCIVSCSFLICNHLDWEERADGFTLFDFLMLCDCYFYVGHPWVDLQCVMVVFPDHTHLRFCIPHDVVCFCQVDICMKISLHVLYWLTFHDQNMEE